jgi:hypothetical protein
MYWIYDVLIPQQYIWDLLQRDIYASFPGRFFYREIFLPKVKTINVSKINAVISISDSKK